MRERMERRTAPLRAEALSAAKAAQMKVDDDAKAAYQAQYDATGLPKARADSFLIQFFLIGLGMGFGHARRQLARQVRR